MPARPKWSFALYTRRQQLALWGLLVLVVLVFGLSSILHWSPRELEIDDNLLAAAAELNSNATAEERTPAYTSNNSARRYGSSNSTPGSDRPIAREAESFAFDPNRVTQEDLERLGLKEYQAKAWVRYRESGAQFRNAEDISRLRVLKPEDVERLLPLVNIEREQTQAEATEPGINNSPISEGELSSSNSMEGEEEGPVVAVYEARAPIEAYTDDFTIDVNTATAADLQQIRGIGPYWAGRIIKFRDALGGFVDVEQVATTYGLPDSTFQAVKRQLAISPVQKIIAINLATADELKAHPYINSRLAGVLVNYREQHGPFQSGEDLGRIRILTEEGRTRLLPYLDFSLE